MSQSKTQLAAPLREIVRETPPADAGAQGLAREGGGSSGSPERRAAASRPAAAARAARARLAPPRCSVSVTGSGEGQASGQ